MESLQFHFRQAHQIEIGDRTADRLEAAVRGMWKVDAGLRLNVIGADVDAQIPRRADVTLGELRAVLGLRRRVA